MQIDKHFMVNLLGVLEDIKDTAIRARTTMNAQDMDYALDYIALKVDMTIKAIRKRL